MQLNYWKNILPPVDGMQKISAICWAPNGRRLACAGSDRSVQMFNENGEKKDKFPTKGSEKGQSYIIRAMEFSPDSQRIAIAQSDNIVFVYKVGSEWGDKKSICNKFPTSSSVTAMCWPRSRNGNSQTDLCYGLAEGKVKQGVHRNNKSQQLYQTDSYVVSIGTNKDGTAIISGHLDGSIYLYNFEVQQANKIKLHHSVPYTLIFAENIVAAGNDQKVSFYDFQGNTIQRFDYSNDEKCRDFTCGSVNPSGDSVVLGNFNRFYMYQLNKRRGQWEEIGIRHIDNYYNVTSVAWKLDGSKLIIGSLCGSVDGFDLSLKKVKYKGKFEFNYVSPSQVVIKTISTGSRVAIKTELAPEIQKINVLQDRYIVAQTGQSLLIGDLETGNLSEIQWRGSGKEKFDFSNPGVCMVSNSGELTLIEFGNNEPLGNCRTEFVKSSLISVRLGQNMKVIAFLLDQQTIRAINLSNGGTIAQVTSESKIDQLELNVQGNKLIFLDKKKQLHLFDFKTQQRNTLLNYCQFAQWIPESEVIVAQNRSNLCVWYSVMNPDKVTIYRIKGDVEDVIRSNSKTEVLVNEAQGTVVYELEEPLIQFGFCVETRDLEKAANILDPLEINEETEANWKTLAKISLEEENLQVAEHCYAALGDVCKARYLRQVNKLVNKIDIECGQGQGIRNHKVRAKLLVLDKQYSQAEAQLLGHEEIEEAMDMYQTLHKWDEAIKIAEKKNIPDVLELKKNYFDWLLDSNQEGKAGEIKEQEGELILAVDLYLKGGLPALAANVVFNYDTAFPQDILERIANSLSNSGMQERAGEFYEQMDQLQKALDCYCKGNAFSKAIELAKRSDPRLMQSLEEKWGDYLVQQRQTEQSIPHFIEANCFQKAIEAAINSRQWNKASQLLAGQNVEVARPFYRQIAKHYSENKQYDLAEKYYLKAGMPIEAFEVYISCGKWENALRVARENLPEQEVQSLLVKQGEKLELSLQYKESERLYLLAEQPDYAIRMYKRVNQYDNIIRLVSRYRRDLLQDTHIQMGQKLENEGQLKQSEQHYIEGGQWNLACEMYCKKSLWEEAIRVCKHNGNDLEVQELAKRWAEVLGPQQSIKMLLKHNLVEAVVEYMMDRKQFDEAFKMCHQNAKHKVADVHLKLALQLEDERRFKEAEEHFVKAGRPAEAINMYEHQQDFQSALSVARQYDPNNLPNVLVNQAKHLLDTKQDTLKAENCYVQARKPELAVRMYLHLGQQQEALRVAKKHCPQLINELNKDKSMISSQGAQTGDEIRNSARLWEEQRDYTKAIDTYLELEKHHFQDYNILEECWERAVQLALNFQREKAQDVVRIVSKRLKDIARFEAAAELLENVGLIEEAVHFYLSGNLFERAKQCANQVKNQELNSRLLELINKSYKGHLKGTNQAEEMINQGEYQQGLEMLAENQQWDKCLESAKKTGKDQLNRYLMRFAKFTMENGRFNECIQAFSEYSIQNIPQNYSIYKTLFLEIFVESDEQEIFYLRNCLIKFINVLEKEGELNNPAGKEFSKYLQVAHLVNLKNLYEKENVQLLLSKLSVSLLRYSNLIRLDKVYYEAGINCKKQNWIGFGLMLINRYLDIYDVIEDQDSNTLGDNSEYQLTDLPSPYDCPLPNKNLLSEQEKEKIKNWCLNILFDSQIKQELPLRKCEFCNTQIYEPSLKCHNCKSQWEPCIITGYPLIQAQGIVNCKSCNKSAIKEYFNIYLQNFANCPWCNQSPN